VEAGLELIETGAPSIPAKDIHDWMLSDDDALPFPAGRVT
jgi:hypothetical protein